MRPWMYFALTIVGSMALLETAPEQAGRIVSRFLREKLGRLGGRKVEKTLIIRPMKAFIKGAEEDDQNERQDDTVHDPGGAVGAAGDYAGSG